MAVIRSRRVRDAGMGGLVQQPAALGAHRQHPAGRSRGTLLRHAGTTCHGGVTQTKWPPTNPGRFRSTKTAVSKLVLVTFPELNQAFDVGERLTLPLPVSFDPVKGVDLIFQLPWRKLSRGCRLN